MIAKYREFDLAGDGGKDIEQLLIALMVEESAEHWVSGIKYGGETGEYAVADFLAIAAQAVKDIYGLEDDKTNDA